MEISVDKNGYTLLHTVVSDPIMVEQLLLQGADINATDNFNNSALHIAVKEVQLQCVKVLLRYYCDVNLQNLNGNMALHLAIDSKNTDLINLLCNCERVDFTLQNRTGLNVLHYAVTLGNTYAKFYSAVNKLVTRAPHLVDMKNKYGSTALHLAASHMEHGGEVSAILLSEHVRATVDLPNSHQRTPLHIATYQQNWSVVELLVYHDADISKADCCGDTVMHIAILRGLKEPITPRPESSKDSPLIYAIWQNLARQDEKTELALACFLISVDKSGKLLDHVRNGDNLTPLHLLDLLLKDSVETQRYAIFLLFYNYQCHNRHLRGQLAVSTWVKRPVDVKGRTSLHHAAIRKDPNMMKQLLLLGADINAVDKENHSALHFAVLFETEECIDVLLRNHCDVNLQNSEGNTALHWAIEKNDNPDVINLLCDCERVDLTLQNKKGSHVLHHAVTVDNIPAVKKLVTRAPHLVDLKDKNGFTALHLAAFGGKYGREVSAILLSQHVHATIDLGDCDQQTPLHIATSDQNWSLVELLVRHDADISKADCYGDTVLHNAIFSLEKRVTKTPKNRKDSPFIYAIWQNLAKQGAKTELALACFLLSVDKSGKLLEHARNKCNQTPLDVMKRLIDSSEFPRCAYILRSYNYYSHLRVKNSLGLMKYLRTREIM